MPLNKYLQKRIQLVLQILSVLNKRHNSQDVIVVSFFRFLCSEEDEGFSTEPVSNKQNGGPLGFYFNQKVRKSYC